MPTLVIVDMQPCFVASNEPAVLRANLKEIHRAIRNGWGIIILEYCGHGPTHKCLLDAVENYEKHTIVPKSIDDGSDDVLNEVRQRGFDTSHFIITGVNLGACVQATALGLIGHNAGPKIQIVPSACNQPDWAYPLDRKSVVGFLKKNGVAWGRRAA